jgi:membrane protein
VSNTHKTSFWSQLIPLTWQTIKDTSTDNGPQWAAAIAYHALLSVFPLMLAAVSIASYFVPPNEAISQLTHYLGEYLPRGQTQIRTTIQEVVASRGATSAISVLLLLWTGSHAFGVLAQALNIAYDVDDQYTFLQRFLLRIGMTVGVGLLFLLALGSSLILGALGGIVQAVPAGQGLLALLVDWAAPALLLLAAYFLVYQFVPYGRQDWRASLSGAVLASALFFVVRALFNSYVQQFGQYNLVYGSLAIVIVLMIWAWIMALITLLGGEFSSHIRMMILDNHPAEHVDRRHRARSPLKQRAQGTA